MHSIIVNAQLEADIRKSVVDFALSNYRNRSLFTFNGPGRQFHKIDDALKKFTFKSEDLMSSVFNSIGLYRIKEEPIFGIFIGVNNAGGNVHAHTDPAPNGLIHTRINFLLSKPLIGGMPVINGVTHFVDEGQSWINLANIWNHSSTVVQGEKNRIVLSVGSLIDENELKEKYHKLFTI